MQPVTSLSSRWKLLDVAPTLTREVALVVCNRCASTPLVQAVTHKAVNELRPHLAFEVSVDSLQVSDGVSAKRLLRADGVVALRGCSDCDVDRLDAVRGPDAVIDLAHAEDAAKALEQALSAIDSVAGVPTITRDQPWVLRPAAQTWATMPLAVQSGAAASAPSKAKAPAAASGQGSYFLAQKRSSRGKAVVLAAVALVLAGWLTYRWYEAGTTEQHGRQVSSAVQHGERRPAVAGASLPRRVSVTEQRSHTAQPVAAPAVSPSTEAKVQTEPGTVDHARDDAQPETASKTETPAAEPAASVAEQAADESTADTSATEPAAKRAGHAVLGEIGDVCASTGECRGGTRAACIGSDRQRVCSQTCTKWCPDRHSPQRQTTHCVASAHLTRHSVDGDALEAGGYCLLRCDPVAYPSGGCPSGLRCEALPLTRNARWVVGMCVP